MRSTGGWRAWVSARMLMLHLLVVSVLAASLWLGVWQLDVWKRSGVDSRLDLVELPAKPLTEVLGPNDAFPNDQLGQRVSTKGRWLSADSIYISERRRGEQTGYWLLTPLQTCGASGCEPDPSGSALPVVVGWLPAISGPPAAIAPQGEVDFVGWLQQPEQDSEPDADPNDDVIASLRLPLLIDRVATDLYSAYAIDTTPTLGSSSWKPVTPATLPTPPDNRTVRNLLYALQWWIFGAFACFVWWRWTHDELREARTSAENATSGVGPLGAPDGSSTHHKENNQV